MTQPKGVASTAHIDTRGAVVNPVSFRRGESLKSLERSGQRRKKGKL